VARLVGRQQNVWTEEDRATARGPELEVVTVGRYGVMRDDAEPVLGDVSPVNIPSTPGIARALSTSIATMRACG